MSEDTSLSLVLVPRWLRAVVGAVGAVLLVTGAVAVFVSTNELGTAVVLATGAALVALGLFANNIRSIEGAGLALTIEAERAERDGRPDQAQALRARARGLLAASRPLAEKYEDIRRTRPSSWQRSQDLDGVVDEARAQAGGVGDADDVALVFDRGGTGDRIWALGVMQGDPTKVPAKALAEAVRRPHSSFEQYHALRAVEGALGAGLSAADDALLRDAVQTALQDPRLPTDSDRSRLARRLLAR